MPSGRTTAAQCHVRSTARRRTGCAWTATRTWGRTCVSAPASRPAEAAGLPQLPHRPQGARARIVDLDRKTFDHNADRLRAARASTPRWSATSATSPSQEVLGEAPSDCNACHRKDDVAQGLARTQVCRLPHRERLEGSALRPREDALRADRQARRRQVRRLPQEGPDYKAAPRDLRRLPPQGRRRPKGHKGRYGEKCETCHGTKAWKPSTFNHDNDTKYLLRGKHRSVKCADCHTGHLYRDKVGSACIDCHKKDDDGVKGHKGALGRDCAACHTERGWKEKGKFDHDKTRFPLLGKHVETKCAACHKSTNYRRRRATASAATRRTTSTRQRWARSAASCHGERDWKTVAASTTTRRSSSCATRMRRRP
jgi:cytochrome c556